ncbi:hypothetical protein ACQEU6_36810 [Spirillospora sp. CA-108201]
MSAWRVFTRYRRLLDEEMGLQPSAAFRGLLERCGRTPASRRTAALGSTGRRAGGWAGGSRRFRGRRG